MNEKEKRFKIKKILKYNNELDNEQKSFADKTFLLGLYTLGFFCSCIVMGNNTEIQLDMQNITNLALIAINLGFSVHYLKEMIESISKKIIFKFKIDDINEMIDTVLNEDKKGMKI